MQISQDSSTRISLLRFPLIAGVVLIHTFQSGNGVFFGSGQLQANENSLTLFVQFLFSENFARTAVPLFFIISAVLFFKDFSGSFSCYRRKIKSRINTILIPYFLWNFVSLLIKYSVELLPNSSTYLSGRNALISSYSVQDYIGAFLWAPASYHLWFLKDLFIMMLLSPIIYLMVDKFKVLPILLLYIAWLGGIESLTDLINRDDVQALIFFCLGCLIITEKWNLNFLDQKRTFTVGAYLFSAIVLAFLQSQLFLQQSHPVFFVSILSKTILLLGVCAAWCLSSLLRNTRMQQFFIALAPFSFFIYAAHEPFLTVVRKIVYRFFPPSNSAEIILYYFLLPAFVISFLTIIGYALNNVLPRLYSVITGSRRVQKKPRPS